MWEFFDKVYINLEIRDFISLAFVGVDELCMRRKTEVKRAPVINWMT